MKKLAIISGTTFVIAWIAGLLVAGGGPKPSDPATKIAVYFAAHEHAAMLEHFLIDAVAGAALVGLALIARGYSRLAFTAGLAAATISFIQAAIGETMALTAAHGGTPGTVHTLFTTLNDADNFKIASIATMIAAVAVAARKQHTLPSWFTGASLAFAPILALSGLAFPLDNNALYSLLYLSLPLLLIWVATFTTTVARHSRTSIALQAATA